MPTIAQGAESQLSHEKKKNAKTGLQDTQDTMKIVDEAISLDLKMLIPPDGAHAQWDGFNCEPASSPFRGKGEEGTSPEQCRGLRRRAPPHDAKSTKKGKQPPDTQSPWPSRWKD